MKPRTQQVFYIALFYVLWFVVIYMMERYRKPPQSADDFGNSWMVFMVFLLTAVVHFIICLFRLIRGNKDYILAAALHAVMLIIIANYFFI